MNRDCPDSQALQRLFDREGPRDDRLAVARHVRRCPPCREVLRGFAVVGRAVRALPMPSAANVALARVREEVRRLRQVELIGWLRRCTAVAAAVLVVSLVAPAVLANRGEAVRPTAENESTYVSSPDDTLTPGHSVAQWIVRDLSQG